MNGKYTNADYTDMHFIYGQANGNAEEAVRRYQANFPNRRQPSAGTFVRLHQRLRDTGMIQPKFSDCGRQRTRQTIDAEEAILHQVEENPAASTRGISRATAVSRHVVWRTLRENLLHPYHIQRVQFLEETDFPRRMQFCQWLLRRHGEDLEFASNILFTDEANFSRRGVMNYHNYHHWAEENPHITRNARFQQEFSLNVWAGICSNRLIGPYILPARLAGATFLDFLENVLPDLLEDLPLGLRRNMWFLLDGAPAHFSVHVRNWLNGHYPNRWVGRNGPVVWPPRSPDINPIDFFLWGHIKNVVYATEVQTVDDLWQRIQAACTDLRQNPNVFERVRNSFLRRAEVCIQVHGGHFEQLL